MDPTTQRMMMSSSGGQIGIKWEDRSLFLPDGAGAYVNSLLDVQLCGGVFIAVGLDATILRSTDAITWTRCTPPAGSGSSTIFTSAAYSSALDIIVVTSTVGIAYSNNGGVTWGFAVTGLNFEDIAFGNNRFVAVGGTGLASAIYTSTDGTSWTSVSAPAGVTDTFNSIAYGTPSGVAGGRWVAIANTSGGVRYIYADNTATTWVNVGVTSTDSIQTVRYVAGTVNLYIATGFTSSTLAPFIKTSATGNAAFPTAYTNTAQIGTDTSNAITYTGSTIVLAGGANQVVTSTNGTTWTLAQVSKGFDAGTSGVAYSIGLGRYVFVGSLAWSGGGFAAGASLWYSSNGLRSGSTIVYDSASLYGAVYVPALGKYFVAGAAGKVFTSTDLTTWTGKYLSQSIIIRAFYFDGTRIIAGGTTSEGDTYMFSSTDGVSWIQDFSGGSGYSVRGGVYGGYNASAVTNLIYGTGSRTWNSSNGTTWSAFGVSNNLYESAVRINDPNIGGFPFTLLGSGTSVSPSGTRVDVTFDPASSFAGFDTIPSSFTGGNAGTCGAIGWLQKPNLADSRLIFAINRSSATYLITSPYPSLSYTSRSVGSASQLLGVAVTPSSSIAVVVGYQTISPAFPNPSYSIPYIQTSSDAATWTQRVTPGSTTYRSRLQGVNYANNRFIAVGQYGVVLVSEP